MNLSPSESEATEARACGPQRSGFCSFLFVVCCNFIENSCNYVLAPRGEMIPSPSMSETTKARGCGPPAKRGRECVHPFFLQVRFLLKKVENPFDFSRAGCKLSFGMRFRTKRNSVPSSFQPYFNQKHTKTDQVYKYSFDSEFEIPAGALCLRFCWAFLCRLWIGFLVGPSCARMGKRPAFFVSVLSAFPCVPFALQ